MKFIHINILILFVTFHFSQNQKIVKNVIRFISGTSKILVSFGTPKRPFFIDIDLVHNYSMLVYPIIVNTTSPTLKIYNKSSIIHNSISVKGHLMQESFIISDKNNEIIEEFFFYYIHDNKITKEGTLSFSIENDDEKLSILHQLSKKGYIEKKQFGIISGINEKMGTIYFGGIPKGILINKYETKIKVNDQFNLWGFTLNSIIIHEQVYPMNVHIYFDISYREMQVPIEFMDFLNNEIFKPYFRNNSCSILKTNVYECLCEHMTKFPSIVLVFEGKQFMFNYHTLFDFSGQFCYFMMKVNQKNQNEWIIGSSIFKGYMVLFDSDNKIISFYSSNPILEKNKKRYLLVPLYILLILSLFILTILLIGVKIKLGK